MGWLLKAYNVHLQYYLLYSRSCLSDSSCSFFVPYILLTVRYFSWAEIKRVMYLQNTLPFKDLKKETRSCSHWPFCPYFSVYCVPAPPTVYLQYMQKRNPLYSQLKEDTVWSMESFNAYVNDWFQVAMGLPRDWVLGAFAVRPVVCCSSQGPITSTEVVVWTAC